MILTGTGIIDSQRIPPPPPVLENFFVGGNFTSYKGQTRNRLVKLDTSGNEVAGFSIGTGFNGKVNVVRQDANGKIYVGGEFTTYQGVTANRIVRLNSDGSRDTTFSIGTGFNYSVADIQLIDGLVYAGGDFTSYQGATTLRLVRINVNGSLSKSYNPAFNTNILFSPFLGVRSILSYSNAVLCGGNFTSFDGIFVGPVLLVNKNGGRNTSFASSYEGSADISKLLLLPNNKVLRVGYGAFGGDKQCVRLNSNGTLDTFWINFINGTALSATTDSGGNYYFVGGFNSFDSVGTPNFTNIPPGLIKTNTSGVRDTSLALGTGFNGTVHDIRIISGIIYVCGDFTSFNGSARNRILSLNANGSINSTFDLGSGFNGTCHFIGK